MEIIAKCWKCKKDHNVSKVKVGKESDGLKCSCGGYIISPSGKMQVNVVEDV